MGMYTEFVFSIELKEETPKNVIKILEFMADESDNIKYPYPKDLPKHEFFETDKWNILFISYSYNFGGISSSKLRVNDISKTYFLTTRSTIKESDQEIEKFLNWIKPYIKGYGHQFLGYKRIEGSEIPSVIYLDNLEGTKKNQMYRVTKIDTLNENKVITEIELYLDEIPVIINDKLYIMYEEEYKAYKNGTLETYVRNDDYIVKCGPFSVRPHEKFVIEDLGSNM
ncbi:hypothetical protein [Paraclostridium bifermentans]|uniref:hypothetical protein n=1 Tax=Paraclostridium bifermentans TaxID=1490 RepID=UPI00189A3716|nr:hypothetical protein [Paraclostridium bifermentans]